MMSPAFHRGFSLIELVVVTAVVSILIGLSLGALAGARRTAQSTACQANLRTLGHAVLQYADANHNVLPYADRIIDARPGTDEWLHPLIALEPYLMTPPPRMDESGEVVTSKVFLCPSDRWAGPSQGMSYGYLPGVFMQVTPGSNAAREVSMMYLREWRMAIWVEGRWHAGVTPTGRNEFTYDGRVGVVRPEPVP